MSFSGFWAKVIALLAKYCLADLSKLHFRCPESFFRRNPVFGKKTLLPIFKAVKKFFFGILTKSFRRGYGSCIPRVREVFWEKKLSVFETKLIFTFYGSERHNLYFLQKTTLRVFRNHILRFWRTILRIVFETKININFFPVIVIEDQVSYFGDTLLAWMWKRKLLCPEEIFEDKCFAVEKKSISKTYLWTLRNTFRAFCKKNVWSCHSRYLDSILILRG